MQSDLMVDPARLSSSPPHHPRAHMLTVGFIQNVAPERLGLSDDDGTCQKRTSNHTNMYVVFQKLPDGCHAASHAHLSAEAHESPSRRHSNYHTALGLSHTPRPSTRNIKLQQPYPTPYNTIYRSCNYTCYWIHVNRQQPSARQIASSASALLGPGSILR